MQVALEIRTRDFFGTRDSTVRFTRCVRLKLGLYMVNPQVAHVSYGDQRSRAKVEPHPLVLESVRNPGIQKPQAELPKMQEEAHLFQMFV